MREATGEEWRAVVGYEGLYEVSTLGRVRRPSGRMLTTHINSEGYVELTVRVWNRETQTFKSRSARVHALMLEAFVGPRPDGCVSRHLNGVRTDNRVENLAWGTHRENALDRRIHGTQQVGSRSNFAKLTEEQVMEIRRSPLSPSELAPIYGVHRETIRAARDGKKWKHLPSEAA